MKMLASSFEQKRRGLRETILCLGLLALSACTGATPDQETVESALETASPSPADIIFVGGNIITMDGSDVQAVAVSGDIISATGSQADVLRYKGEDTRVVELDDQALLPGFIDAHSHITAVANVINLANLSSPPVGDIETMSDLVDGLRVKLEADATPPGEWVVGYGYDDSLLAEKRHPTRSDLNLVSTTHPVAIMHVSGHLVVANTMALEMTGITAQSEDPLGGHIRRESGSQQPNGVLEETATAAVMGHIFTSTPEDLPGLMGPAMDVYAEQGFTTVQDGASSLVNVAALKAAAAESPFPLDLVMFPHIGQVRDCTADQFFEADYTGRMRVGGVKFVLDGSPQGRTAFLTEPYTLVPEGKSVDYRGYPSMLPEVVNAKAAECLSNGVPMLMHANGDAAIDMVIDAMRAAIGDAGVQPDHRTVIIHGQLMREDQLDDVKALGLVPSYYSAHPFFWGDWHAKIFGEKRASRISPIRSTIDRDIPFTIHNDAPVIPPMGMRLVDIAVNRKTRSGRVLGQEQKATPYEALYAMTMGGAYQYFEEDQKGSITPGKLADLVILEANPLAADPETLADIDVLETISHGKSVYAR